MRVRLVCFTLAFVASTAFSIHLPTLQSRINATGANWVAGETSISRLSPAEIQRRLGAELPEGFGDHFRPAVTEQWTDSRASFDWRNVNGVNYVSPVLNQAHCGSCVAFAAVGTMETQFNVTRKTTSSAWAFSTQHLFACGGGGCETGWQPASAANYLKTQGVPDEACYPYHSGATGEDMSCSSTCSDVASRKQRIIGYTQPTFFFADLNAIKTALQKGPLMTVMMVYEDFLYYKNGVYKHVTGELAGGHAVMIVGYNDAEQALIVRNSWGTEWGEEGFFRIAYNDTSNLGSQSWLFEVPSDGGYVTTGVRDNEVLRGNVSLNMESTFAGTESIEWTLTRDNRPMWWGETVRGKRVNIDTTQFADGTYILQAIAHYSGGQAQSQPRRVHVLNGNFNGAVKVTNISAGQQLSEPTDFDLELQNSPVPFTKITFRARNLKTGEETVRASSNTLPKMIMFWRANLATEGDYELTFTGSVGSVTSVASAPVKVKVVKK